MNSRGPCSPPDRLAGSNGAAWGHGATVTVTINPNDFPTTAERQAIQPETLLDLRERVQAAAATAQ